MKVVELAVIGFFVILVRVFFYAGFGGFFLLVCLFWGGAGRNCKTQIMKQRKAMREREEKNIRSVFIYLGTPPGNIILLLS